MSTDLFLHGREVHSVFALMGTHENAITYSLGWVLAHSKELQRSLITTLFPKLNAPPVERISLQEAHGTMGITDVELLGPELHVIIEAKRGWVLPTDAQLQLYAPRFEKSRRRRSMFVTMSESSAQYARIHLPRAIGGVPVRHVSWKDIARMTLVKNGTHAEKRLLLQFRTYIGGIVRMQNQESNLVYLVSLGRGAPSGSSLSWRGIVVDRRRYFHPVGGSWPKEPPNYLGFRYDGRLQSIHHVEGWEVVTDMHERIPEIPAGQWKPHVLYTLGEPVVPLHKVRTGSIYPSGRVWAMLDLLLTCHSIAEARDKTKARYQAE